MHSRRTILVLLGAGRARRGVVGRRERHGPDRQARTRAVIQRLLLLLAVTATPAAAAQDGRALFQARCAACHATAPSAPPGPGPNLAGVVGRQVGGDPRFDYSPVFQAARREGRVWDAAALERFLSDPEGMFPGLWMGSNGLRVPGERAAVVAFLARGE